MLKVRLISKEVKKFIIIFYIVGVLGFIIPLTNEIFKILIPYALLVNFFVLWYFHDRRKIRKSLFVFLTIFLFGFIIEMIGVETKIIFGNYSYGSGLGIKIFETPLLIGLNWLFLSYTSLSIVEKFKIPVFLKILFSVLLMVLYDIVLEHVAPFLNMWSWENNQIPLQNFIAWFFISFIFITLLKICKINTKNPLSLTLLISQSLFFIILMIYFLIIK